MSAQISSNNAAIHRAALLSEEPEHAQWLYTPCGSTQHMRWLQTAQHYVPEKLQGNSRIGTTQQPQQQHADLSTQPLPGFARNPLLCLSQLMTAN